MIRIGLAVVASLLMVATVNAQIILYQNDMSVNNWDPVSGPEWSNVTSPVWIDGGIPGGHAGGGSPTGLGRLTLGAPSGTGATLSWDDSAVNYNTDVVTVSFWVSQGFSNQASVSGRFFGMGLGNGSQSFTNAGGAFVGRTDFIWEGASHDTTAWGSNRGFHGTSSGGGFNTNSAANGRGMWSAQFDTSLSPDGWDYFQMIYEIDITAANPNGPEIRILHYDPLSGDAAPVQVARHDLSNVNALSADGIDELRFENLGSTIPDYWIDDVMISYVPEPASMALLALGGLAVLRRKRR